MKRLLTILALTAACASNPAPPAETAAKEETPSRGVEQFAQLRAEVDRAGASADCSQLPTEATEASWLAGWCAFRTNDYDAMARHARRAQRYFGEAGEIRRSAEAWTMVAIAEMERGSVAEALDAARRAADLVEWGALNPEARTDDPYGADLAYLEASLAARGLVVTRSASVDRKDLLNVAAGAARRRGQRSSAAHILRALGPAELDSGDVRAALDALSGALAIELRDENTAGIRATLDVTADVVARLGVPEVRAWLDGSDLDLDDEVLPGTPDFAGAMRLRATDHGRRQLARMIAAYRSSPDARLRPDTRLMDLLRDPETLRYSAGRSWSFTFHAGLLLRDVGAFQESRKYLEQSVESIETMRRTIPDASLRQRFFAGKRPAYESLVEHYVGIATADRPRTDVRRAFSIANATKARGLLDLLDGTIDPEMTIAPTARWRPTNHVQSQGETLQARLKTWVSRPTTRETDQDPFASLDAFSSAYSQVRFVEYIIGERVGFVFVSGGGELDVRKVSGASEMAPRIEHHSRLLRDSQADPTELRASAERLYVDLMAPIQDLIVGADQLVIAPDAAIANVEFAALARPSEGSAPRWLIRDHAVSYIPSTAVAQRIAARETPITKGSLLLGDPDLDRSALALASLSSAASEVAFDRLDERFAPLPGAREEVRVIAQSTPTPRRARSGSAATESLVLRPRVIPLELLHIAAHGVADGREGLDVEQPAILLARAEGAPRDGILTLEEILVLQPKARVVTLSGCETGVGWQSLGDNAFGLAGAFLFAGSEVVVASSWKVEDRAAKNLMQSFYRNRKRGEAEALRRAQIELAKRRAPFYWASFRVFGGLPESPKSPD